MMDMGVQNRETQLSLMMVAFLFYHLVPITYWLWLFYRLDSGAFPVNADSMQVLFFFGSLVWC
jgi:hypothetical protein